MPVYRPRIDFDRPDFLGDGNWDLSDLNEVTVIFGRNGSGKSIFLRMLRDRAREETHYLSPERSGDISHSSGLLQDQYTGAGRSQRRGGNQANEFRQESVTRLAAILMRLGELAGRKAAIDLSLSDIEAAVNELLPDFQFRITGERPPHYSLTRIIGAQEVSSVGVLSSGEAEVLSIALDLLTVCALWKMGPPGDHLLLLDEPDLHLHPDLQQGLARFLVQLPATYPVQVIIATHSVALLSAVARHGGTQASVIYFARATPVLRALPFDEAIQQVAACLGGHALMGPLFGLPLLLVEGDDDYKLWSAVPRGRSGSLPYAAIPCGGAARCREFAATLERVLRAVGETGSRTLAYVLLDGDQVIPGATGSSPVGYVKLNCHEAENLYLTDEVLGRVGKSWEEAQNAISERASGFGEKTEPLLAVANADRRTSDVKPVIHQLVQILDPKQVDWALRVGRSLGESRPQGQLQDFLGQDVVARLWSTRSE